MTTPELQKSHHVRNIAVDIILTVISCGLYNIYVQYVQIKALNDLLKFEKYYFVHWALFTLITCGLYHLYHEFRMSDDLTKLLNPANPNASEPILCLVISAMGFSIVADCIQQTRINALYGSQSL